MERGANTVYSYTLFLAVVLAAPVGASGVFRSCTNWLAAHNPLSITHVPSLLLSPQDIFRKELTLANEKAFRAMESKTNPRAAFKVAPTLSAAWAKLTGSAQFGVKRQSEMLVEVLSWELERAKKRALPLGRTVQDSLIPRLIASQSELPGFIPEAEPQTTQRWVSDIQKMWCTYYGMLSGEQLVAGCFIFHEAAPEGITYLLRTPPENIPRILNDLTIRLEQMRDSASRRPSTRLEEFAALVYGYYQAYPLQVGTQEFGWAIFSGFFRSLFRRDLPESPNETTLMEWLTLSKAGFVENFLAYLGERD